MTKKSSENSSTFIIRMSENANEQLPADPSATNNEKDKEAKPPPTSSSLQPSPPTIQNPEPQAIPNNNSDNQPQTVMEVHKHPHHVMHKKKWEEYFLEFFMLFLAVFLGFIAENIREHIVEKERLQRHMHTMVENLKYDTIRCAVNRQNNLENGKGLDSFRAEIKEAIGGSINANRLYYFCWRYGRGVGNPALNDAAMSQLKSSGMLRLIKNDSLVNEMTDYYDRKFTSIAVSKEDMQLKLRDITNVYEEFFSYDGFDELLQHDAVFTASRSFYIGYYLGILNRQPELKLLTTDPAKLEMLYSKVAELERTLRNYDSYILWTKESATSLMSHIQKEYGFE